MKALLEQPAIVVAARLLVGSIFLFASIEKASDPWAFAVLIDNYQFLPFSINLMVATFLPWLELVCGLTLVLGISHRGSALLIGAMTAVFTVAVISAIARDLDISCGCFTLDPEVSRVGWRKVAENAGIIVLSVFLVYSRTNTFSLANLNRPEEPEEDRT